MLVLRDPDELARAAERAAEGERRLQARLDARAARDAWTAERGDGGQRTLRPVVVLRGTPLPPPRGTAESAARPSSHQSPAA